MVEPDDSKERMYFRYYDPRVLRDFLPLATTRQRTELFGDISVFVLESEDGEVLRIDPFDTEESAPETEAGGGGTHVPNP